MPRYIVKLNDPQDNKDYYLEWSTVVDAPITYGLSLAEFHGYYQEEYGRMGMQDLSQRMERVEQKGCSSLLHDNADDLISGNHAGEKGEELSKDQIIEKFCRLRPAE